MGEVDVLVLPGGGTARQVDDERVLTRVRALNEKGTLLTSVCTGSLVLAAAGLLKGRPGDDPLGQPPHARRLRRRRGAT